MDPRRRIRPGYQVEGEILPDRQQSIMAGYPRLRNLPDNPVFRGSMVGEADGASVLPAIGSVIHSPLWAAKHQGLTSC
jgi:hypothetical protein